MANLRDVVICYDRTVRNVCSNSIIQFEYGVKTRINPLRFFTTGELVGVLAATTMSNPAYKAVLDSSPSSNSSWELMRKSCSVKSTLRMILLIGVLFYTWMTVIRRETERKQRKEMEYPQGIKRMVIVGMAERCIGEWACFFLFICLFLMDLLYTFGGHFLFIIIVITSLVFSNFLCQRFHFQNFNFKIIFQDSNINLISQSSNFNLIFQKLPFF